MASRAPRAENSPALKYPDGSLLPPVSVSDGSPWLAAEAQRAGLAPTTTPEQLRERVVAAQGTPAYSRHRIS